MTLPGNTSSCIHRQRGFWLRCFLEYACVAVAIVLTLASSALRSQDCIDTHGRPCSTQDTRRMRAVTCKTEVVSPNLFVAAPTTVSGFLLDQTGAPFAIGEQTVVEVRDPKKSKAMYSAPVNLRGRFDLGLVKAGTFRLVVAIKVHGGVLERVPGFDQPGRMDCSGDGECNIRPIVRADHSEDSLASCPPK